MEYISTKEAAEKWGVSLRHVQRLLHENRIPGARKYGVSWLIPAGEEKPADPRQARESNVHDPARQSLLPPLDIHDGDLAAAYERCSSPAERCLLDAHLAYFRGDPQQAKELALPLYQSATDSRVKLGGGFILALSAMYLGDTRSWRDIISALGQLDSPGLDMARDAVVGMLNVALHGRDAYPHWLKTGAFTGLPDELFPIARLTYAKILYIKWKEVDLLAVAEPLIAECRRDKSDLIEAYLRLVAAVAYQDLGDTAQARAHVEAAAALALPLGFIAPFVEHRRLLIQVMDDCLKDKYPRQLAEIKKQIQLFFDNWAKVYNETWEHSMASNLTPREYEACMLASRGMEIREIASRMGLARSSVKKYLNAAYNKLGVDKKKQLRQVIHT